jgi:hypothetical protein
VYGGKCVRQFDPYCTETVPKEWIYKIWSVSYRNKFTPQRDVTLDFAIIQLDRKISVCFLNV